MPGCRSAKCFQHRTNQLAAFCPKQNPVEYGPSSFSQVCSNLPEAFTIRKRLRDNKRQQHCTQIHKLFATMWTISNLCNTETNEKKQFSMALQQQLKMYHLKSLPMCQHWMNTYLISKWPTATPALCLNKIPLPTSSTERGSVSHTSIIWQFNHQKLSHYDKSNTYFYLFIILPPDSSAFSTSGTFASALSQSFRTGHVHLTAHLSFAFHWASSSVVVSFSFYHPSRLCWKETHMTAEPTSVFCAARSH